MRTVKILPSFERCLKKRAPDEKSRIRNSLRNLNTFLVRSNPPKGLGFKKLTDEIHELRVDIRIRILVKLEDDAIYLLLVGTHDDIRRYLKSSR